MPAEIFGARFYGYRQPAWHRLGQVSTDRIGAVTTLERLGPYEVMLESLDADASAIIRLPTPDDAQRRCFGRVGPEYVLISPAELAALWDRSAGQPVETMGALRGGRCLFLTMRLRPFQVVLARQVRDQAVGGSFPGPGCSCVTDQFASADLVGPLRA